MKIIVGCEKVEIEKDEDKSINDLGKNRN